MTLTPSRRFIIIGAGAVGGSIAAELVLAGTEVVAVARGAEFDALSTRGLRYLTPGSERTVTIPVVEDIADLALREGDVLVVTTKSQDSEPLLQRLAWLPVTRVDGTIGTAATALPVVTLQNGVSNERAASRWFSRVYGGVLAFPVNKEGVGESIAYSTTLLGLIWLGRYPDGSDEELEQIASDLRAARLGVAITSDIRSHKVSKLVYNTVNVIEPIFAPSALRDELKQGLADEGWAVFGASGHEPVDLWGPESELDHEVLVIGEIEGHPRSGNSTWQSFARGAAVETDYLNGDIVLEGRLAGIPTPLNAAVQERIREVIAGRRESRAGDDELAEFLAVARGNLSVAVS